MQHFALLRQRAREGDEENTALLQQLQAGPAASGAQTSKWDIPLVEAKKLVKESAPRAKPNPAGSSQDQLTYYKAVAASKRGEDALVDHVVNKAQKQLKAQQQGQEAKRQRRDGPNDGVDGIVLSERNKRFNDRL